MKIEGDVAVEAARAAMEVQERNAVHEATRSEQEARADAAAFRARVAGYAAARCEHVAQGLPCCFVTALPPGYYCGPCRGLL